ncbi:unnamed protein product [Somion occarium]|uniref:Uncharacterized protein n=1 Tax=Somion occarium TaxID=3059160 RepID=A0ABP1D820_9APHY
MIMALTLEDATLYLFIRGNPNPPDHHGLYWHRSGKGGKEYHARNIGFGWLKEIGITHGLPTSMGLIILLKLTPLPEYRLKEGLEKLVEEVEVRPYDPTFNCIVWICEVLGKLAEEGLIEFKEGCDTETLLEEVKRKSSEIRDGVMDGTLPSKVATSECCVVE